MKIYELNPLAQVQLPATASLETGLSLENNHVANSLHSGLHDFHDVVLAFGNVNTSHLIDTYIVRAAADSSILK
jgi:hypothetical protein